MRSCIAFVIALFAAAACSLPFGIDAPPQEKFLNERVKVNGKAGVLGDVVSIERERSNIHVTAKTAMSKRYVKVRYLALFLSFAFAFCSVRILYGGNPFVYVPSPIHYILLCALLIDILTWLASSFFVWNPVPHQEVPQEATAPRLHPRRFFVQEPVRPQILQHPQRRGGRGEVNGFTTTTTNKTICVLLCCLVPSSPPCTSCCRRAGLELNSCAVPFVGLLASLLSILLSFLPVLSLFRCLVGLKR